MIGDPIDLPLTPAQEAGDERFRRTFGFNADPTYIASLYQQAAAGTLHGASRNWGALLTADETAEMMARQRLVELTRLPAFQGYLAAHSGEFGGQYFDQASGGAVMVLFTENIDAHRSALSSILGSAATRLRVVQVAHTENELKKFAGEVSADLVWLRDHGVAVVSFGPDVSTNRVVIRAESATPAVLSVLGSRYPGKPWRAEAAPAPRLLGETAVEAPPMEGGLAIQNNVVRCTSGFGVTRSSDEQNAVLGAGHCGADSPWSQGTGLFGAYSVGSTSTFVFGMPGDVEVIPLATQSDGSDLVYISTTSCGFNCVSHNHRVIQGYELAANVTAGEPLCHSLSNEANEYCLTVTAINQCVIFTDMNNTEVCNQIFSNLTATPGDSGSPAYQPQTNGKGLAQGILVCTLNTGGVCYTQIESGFNAIAGAGGGTWTMQASHYNRAAAVSYADQWSTNGPSELRNPSFPDLGNDCTNFASQVLIAGGYPQNGSPLGQLTCDTSRFWQPYQDIQGWHWPQTWTVADCQRQFFASRPKDFFLYPGSPADLNAGGDILQIGSSAGATTPDHSRVLVGPGLDVFTGLQQSNLEDQHTTDEYHLVWNYNIDPSWTLWAWQVTW